MSAAVAPHRRTWLLFLAVGAVLVVAMAASSLALLRSEQAERTREGQRRAAEAMDSWLAPVLAREAGRRQSDYSAYREPRRVFDSGLRRVPAGSLLEPSPLLAFEAETLLLHVQWSPSSGASSPQVPIGARRELALASGVPAAAIAEAERRLAGFVASTDLGALAASLPEPLAAPPLAAPAENDAPECASPDELREQAAGAGLVEQAGEASVGPLTARWLPGERLVLIRDARLRDERLLQLVLVDWPALRRLLAEHGGVGEDDIRPGPSSEGVALAGLPVSVTAGPAPAAGGSPLRTRLAFGWLAGLSALAAVGYGLRRSLAEAERRARFAAAVSHELRTPLTTLRLYSDLLADGLVTEEGARRQYLETIRSESARLASLVENVLLHARVERSSRSQLQRLSLGELLDSIEPVLRRRADEAGRPLAIRLEAERETGLDVDRAAVERVLFNLVDNACKHSAGAEDPTLSLEVRRRGRHVDLQVSDQGPGIPRALGSAVFEAFRRGGAEEVPGAGLGLSLSRALARDLRGELSLVPTERGACFRLSLRLG